MVTSAAILEVWFDSQEIQGSSNMWLLDGYVKYEVDRWHYDTA